MKKTWLFLVLLSNSALAGIYATNGATNTVEFDERNCRFWNVTVWSDNGTAGDTSDDIVLATGVVWEFGCPPQNGISTNENEFNDANYFKTLVISSNEDETEFFVIVVKNSSSTTEGNGLITIQESNKTVSSISSSFSNDLGLKINNLGNELQISVEFMSELIVTTLDGQLIEYAEGTDSLTLSRNGLSTGVYVVTAIDRKTGMAQSMKFTM